MIILNKLITEKMFKNLRNDSFGASKPLVSSRMPPQPKNVKNGVIVIKLILQKLSCVESFKILYDRDFTHCEVLNGVYLKLKS